MRFSMKLATLGAAVLTLGIGPGRMYGAEKPQMQGRVPASESVKFNVYLPLQHHDEMEKDLAAMHDPASATYRKWMTPTQFNAKYGPTASQLKAVEEQIKGYGLDTKVIGSRRIEVTGPAGTVERAFSTQLAKGTYASGKTTVVAMQELAKTGAMAQANVAVAGLSGMIRMQTHSRKVTAAIPANRYASYGGYWFDDLKQAYKFPSYTSYAGKGVTIGILITGEYQQSDMDMYFKHEKLASPHYSLVDVDGGQPFSVDGSFETHLDLQQSGGMAPKAHIVEYSIPDLSDQSIIDGLLQILDDNQTDVVSMSFGGFEYSYTAAFNGGMDYSYLIRIEDELYAQGNAQGITFVASSGDSGALAGLFSSCFEGVETCPWFFPDAEFPASSPHVTGVGGTNLTTDSTAGSLDSAYLSEEAYADPLAVDIFYGTPATHGVWGSGGGSSRFFTKPSYQDAVVPINWTSRAVPDVAGHMGGCPGGTVDNYCNPADSYDLEALGGEYYGVIGTSASAPDFAGLTALAIERFGTRLGNENYYIYGLALSQKYGLLNVFNQGILGYNGYYKSTATKGFNRVLGNGTVNGAAFILAPEAPLAGVPQTPSNP